MAKPSLRSVHIDGQEWKWYVRGAKRCNEYYNYRSPVIFSPDGERTDVPFEMFVSLLWKTGELPFPNLEAVAPGNIVHFIRTFLIPRQIVATDETFSVMILDGSRSIACLNMDLMEDFWWLARVKVEHPWRKQGYGTWMVETAKAHARDKSILVEPGGYDLTHEEQDRFYESCGFISNGDGTLTWKATQK